MESAFSKNTCFITEDGLNVTYGEIGQFSESINNAIKNRSLVFCLCQNSAGSLSGYLAFISGRIVPVLLDAKIDSDYLFKLIALYKPGYIWLPDSRMTDFPDYPKVFSGFNYSLLNFQEEKVYPIHTDLAMLLTTSGSTGSSKFVRISYENMKANAGSIADYLKINENERPITTLPMCYSYGLSVINSHILKGATILLTSKSIVEKDFWKFLINEKATSLAGVPYTYRILEKLKLREMDLPYLRTLTQAGGKLNSNLWAKFSKYCSDKGKRFFVMYGQTEATARMSFLPPEYCSEKTGSIGIPIPGGEFTLMADNGIKIEGQNISGELVYHGKNVSMGYAESYDDLKKGDENKGILFTGDIARRDSDNFYYITGRKNRFIKICGKRISLDETESLLENVIQECACTGEDECMTIHLTDETKTTEIRDYISARTGISPSAFLFRQWSVLPKNEAGKVIYSQLVDL